MSDNIARFFASAIEFVGGGAVCLAALAYLAVAAGWWGGPSEPELQTLALFPGALLTTLAFTVAYVSGVVAEGASRGALEWDLHRMTVRHPAFIKKSNSRSASAGSTNVAVRPLPVKIRFRYLGKSREHIRYTERDLLRAVNRRERMRAKVTQSKGLTDVDDQLKRLRLERMVFLAAAFITLAELILALDGGSTLAFAASLFITFVLFRLVHVRFKRYIDAIARNYYLVQRSAETVSPLPEEK